MLIKTIIDEDLTNYKKPSMLIAFPYCTFKCGNEYCQNSDLAKSQNIEISYFDIINKYNSNKLTSSFVFAGLEPFDSYIEMYGLIKYIRTNYNDDIVIYTGYNKNEISTKLKELSIFKNIIIKFGRYIPNQEKHYDEILGVELASDNQYGFKL